MVAAIGILQSVMGLVAVWSIFSPIWLINIWVILAFATSASLLWITQPQFSAIFALFASAYAETILYKADQIAAPLTDLIPAVLWLLLFQHPVRLEKKFEPIGIAGFVIALLLGLLKSFAPAYQPLSLVFYGVACIALVVLTQRCIALGLLRSPRTIIFAVSVAPLLVGILVEYLFDLPNINNIAKVVVGLFFTVAPIGTLLYEIARNSGELKSLAGRRDPLEHR